MQLVLASSHSLRYVIRSEPQTGSSLTLVQFIGHEQLLFLMLHLDLLEHWDRHTARK